MKRIGMFAATGLIAMLPSLASARTVVRFGFGWPFFAPAPVCVVAPPVVVAPAPVVVAPAPVVVAPAPVVVAPAPVVIAAPAPIVTYCAPAPAFDFVYGYPGPHYYHYGYWGRPGYVWRGR